MKSQELNNGQEYKSFKTYLGLEEKNYVFVADKGNYFKVRSGDILWVSSEGNYAHIHTKEKVYVNRISLSGLLKLLPSINFTKVHKCHVVQIDAIEQIDKTNNEILIEGQKIPIGRSYKSGLFKGFNLIN